MTNFLNFLNTADIDTMSNIPGVTRTIAGNILAARPFDFVEDCAKVHGVGKNLLGRMQSFFEAELNDSRSSAMIPVEEDAMPALIDKDQPAQESSEEGPAFLSRLGRAFINFLRALLRLILIVALIGGIGAILYYGLPYLNKTFIAPVEQSAAQIDKLESDISTLQTQLAEMNNRVDALEKSIEMHTLSIQKLEEMQTRLETQFQTNNDKVLLELKHEIMMTRAVDMLARARLYLAQSNFGLAKVDVQSARNLLTELQADTADEVLGQAVDRLDLVLGNLPAFPVVAAGDLEIAWQLLMTGAPANVATETPTPTPLPNFTPTSEDNATFTPTPLPVTTIVPTVTP